MTTHKNGPTRWHKPPATSSSSSRTLRRPARRASERRARRTCRASSFRSRRAMWTPSKHWPPSSTTLTPPSPRESSKGLTLSPMVTPRGSGKPITPRSSRNQKWPTSTTRPSVSAPHRQSSTMTFSRQSSTS
ncbi:unnamed protein product [Amoebophrya sp. A25]|nr:unnamed protein product [Amoebophrya sp. A25]|eukprot:GSA25T00019944001.1